MKLVFWDLPALAAKCCSLGLVIPLTESLRAEFGNGQVRTVLARLAGERDSIGAALSRAREWEKAVIASRPSVHRRIADLMGAANRCAPFKPPAPRIAPDAH